MSEIAVSHEDEPLAVGVATAAGLQALYDRQIALVMRMGNWLSSPQAQLLSVPEWEEHFGRYQEQLNQLRLMGDELRPEGVK